MITRFILALPLIGAVVLIVSFFSDPGGTGEFIGNAVATAWDAAGEFLSGLGNSAT